MNHFSSIASRFFEKFCVLVALSVLSISAVAQNSAEEEEAVAGAMGAMDAIRYHLKLSIPKDVAVVGFDDIDNAHWPVYSLTTVKPSVERMVQRTVDNLVESQNRDDPVRVMEVVAARLVRRESA